MSDAQLTIDSASFVVQTGAVVTVTGDITSAKSLPDMGKFLLQSTTDSQSVNMNGNAIPNLEIDNSNGVWLTGDMGVSNSLLFTNGKFIAGNHNFSLADIAAVSGMGNGKFIETNGTGRYLRKFLLTLLPMKSRWAPEQFTGRLFSPPPEAIAELLLACRFWIRK